MEQMKKKRLILRVEFLIICVVVLLFVFYKMIFDKEFIGKIYFDKPASWEQVYAYVYDEDGKELLGEWPGTYLTQEKDYIYFCELKTKGQNDIKNYKIIFNDGENYSIQDTYIEYDKIYTLTSGIGYSYEDTVGKWVDYNKDIKIGQIPRTEQKIKNVIYMIGDGMGENHIIAGELYKESSLNIQHIVNKSYVKTSSISTVTDSAAGGTALATGQKTINGSIGLDRKGNAIQNLTEYANLKNMKTGIVCTEILNHATPAAFSVHNNSRYNYEEIANTQIESNIDLMFGGGKKYFKTYEEKMLEKNYKWSNNFSELSNIDKNEKVIGTFGEETISKEIDRVSLADMTEEALYRLENENGFFIMIEGSCIDTYSHESNMKKMLVEMIDFDDAVGIAMDYVDNNPDTLLIVTADHETGGLNLDGVISKEELNDSLFMSNGSHTDSNVPLYAYGIGDSELTQYDIIDNTSIYKFIKQGLDNN